MAHQSNPNPSRDIKDGCENQALKDLHGEWLSAKNGRKNLKSHQQVNGGIKRDRGDRDSSKKNLENNRFKVLSNVGPSKDMGNIPNSFDPSVEARETPKVWKKNKRPRNDGKKGPETRGQGKSKLQGPNENMAKPEQGPKGKGVMEETCAKWDVSMHARGSSSKGPEHKIDKGFGIKTTMDVEVVGLNRLRFVDNPKPPDPRVLQVASHSDRAVFESPEGFTSTGGEAMDEVVEETPTMCRQ